MLKRIRTCAFQKADDSWHTKDKLAVLDNRHPEITMQKFIYLLCAIVALSFSTLTHAQTVPTRRIVIAADSVFDGKGHERAWREIRPFVDLARAAVQ